MTTAFATPQRIWVFGAGALGDHMLIWPLLRAMVRAGRQVTLCAPSSIAKLAASCLGVTPFASEHPEVSRLWVHEGVAAPNAHACADSVVAFLFPTNPMDAIAAPGDCLADDTAALATRATWTANVSRWLQTDHVRHVGEPGSVTRANVWSEFDVEKLGSVTEQRLRSGPMVLHVGAGAVRKRWPIERWASLASRLRDRGLLVEVIAGEVEHEQFTRVERAAFAMLGGRMLGSLDELASTLRGARAFVGADTGPTHLAAQLGLPTLALFGPTNPAIWRPVGPGVRVLAPVAPAPMAWLAMEAVDADLARMM